MTGTLFRGLTVEVFLICIRVGAGMVDHAVTMLRRGIERESRHSGRRHLRCRLNIPSSLFLLLTPRAARSSGRSTLGRSSRVSFKPTGTPGSMLKVAYLIDLAQRRMAAPIPMICACSPLRISSLRPTRWLQTGVHSARAGTAALFGNTLGALRSVAGRLVIPAGPPATRGARARYQMGERTRTRLPRASEKSTVCYRTEPVRCSEYRWLEAMGNVISRFGHG